MCIAIYSCSKHCSYKQRSHPQRRSGSLSIPSISTTDADAENPTSSDRAVFNLHLRAAENLASHQTQPRPHDHPSSNQPSNFYGLHRSICRARQWLTSTPPSHEMASGYPSLTSSHPPPAYSTTVTYTPLGHSAEVPSQDTTSPTCSMTEVTEPCVDPADTPPPYDSVVTSEPAPSAEPVPDPPEPEPWLVS